MPLSARDLLPRAVTASALASLLLATALTGDAGAHGSTTDPPSRVYGCFDRWGSDFQNPAMAEEDPMCWQAWQADRTPCGTGAASTAPASRATTRPRSPTASCAAAG